jgi:MarR family transcriptional regulator, organic hydroperoxide resistance regulator
VDRRLLFLLQRAARAAVAHTNVKLRQQLEISVAQLGTLSLLAERPNCTLTDVAAELDLNKSAVSGMLGRLERAELIARTPDPEDGRATRLRLLEPGKRMRLKARPIFRDVMADMLAGFTAEEQAVVLRFLNSVVARFSADTAAEGESSNA